MKKILFITLLILIKSFVFSQTKHPKDTDQVIRIPIVFHIVNDSLTKSDISDSDLHSIVKMVNDGFNNVNPNFIYYKYRDIVATCNIEFYIPDQAYDDFGNTKPSISWHKPTKLVYESNTNMDSNKQLILADYNLKSNGYVNSSKYLNVWITKLNGVSYSSFPNEKRDLIDGIVLHIKNFYHYDSDEFKKTHPKYTAQVLTHEIGHWLGLYHIWGKSNKNSIFNGLFEWTTDACKDISINDDEILDTPKQKGPNIFDFNGEKKDSMLYVCNSSSILSNYQNFMDYTYHKNSMFTKGQKTKMRYNIFEYRSELLEQSPSNDRKKIAIDNQYINKLEYRITSLDGSNYKSTFHENYKNIARGRYLFEIYDYITKRVIANNIFEVQNNNKGVIIYINKYGCTKWKYINDNRLYEFSFNINKLEGKCNSNSNRTSRNNQNTKYRAHNRNRYYTNRKKSSGNKSYDDAYKRAEKMYKEGYKRANDMYNKARKKYR